MKRFGTTTRIAFAMTMWTATVLLALRMSGVLSDGTHAKIDARTRLCESIAVSCSQFASREDQPAMEASLQLLKARNDDLLSAACRTADGEVLFAAGDHEQIWSAASGGESSSATCIKVPVLSGGKTWGHVEFAFQPPIETGLMGFLTMPSIQVTMIAALSNLLGFLFFLRRCFRQLDPSQAIPTRVRTALDTMAEGIVVLDPKHRINLANQPFSEMVGQSADSLQGKKIDVLDWKIEGDLKLSDYVLQRMENQIDATQNVQITDSGGTVRTLKANISPVCDALERTQGYLLSLDDITVLEEKNRQLQFLATRDPMTGCLNRRSFFESLEKIWSAADRYGHPVSCMMVDVDHFKSINDTYGHAMGDEVLKKVAGTLLDTARDSDYVCRYGGEEFCVLLPHVDIDGVAMAGERYRKAIEALEFPQLKVTASLGCSSSQFQAQSAEQMLEQADQSLYFAKRNGRNQVGRFDRLGSDSAQREEQADQSAPEKSLLESIRELMSEAREHGNSSVSFDELTSAMATSTH